jgi:Na+-transporting methylmalonyl-CoA/oxaloacetate decarboxylase gamma subunit
MKLTRTVLLALAFLAPAVSSMAKADDKAAPEAKPVAAEGEKAPAKSKKAKAKKEEKKEEAPAPAAAPAAEEKKAK